MTLLFQNNDVGRSCTRQRNDVTSRDPAHLYPWVDFVSIFGGFGKVGRHFSMKNNFLTLIDHFFENIWHSDALSTNTVKLNSTGKRKIFKNVNFILLT